MTRDISERAYFDEAPPIIGEIAELAIKAATVNRSDAMTSLARARDELKRVLKRAETLSDQWEVVEMVRDVGSTLGFTGRLLAEQKFRSEGSELGEITFELWETEGGAYVAATVFQPAHGGDQIMATVIKPGEDEQARRFACMDEWGWHDRARSMVRKLGWSLREDVA